MVDRHVVADHTSCLDDCYKGGNRHVGCRIVECRIARRDLLFRTQEAQSNNLRCFSGSCCGGDSSAIVSCCCCDSRHSAEKKFLECQGVVPRLYGADRGLSDLALPAVVHTVAIAAGKAILECLPGTRLRPMALALE